MLEGKIKIEKNYYLLETYFKNIFQRNDEKLGLYLYQKLLQQNIPENILFSYIIKYAPINIIKEKLNNNNLKTVRLKI